MAIYPLNMAPIGVNPWENAFQTIPDISFFGAQKIFLAFFLFFKFGVNCFSSILHFVEELGIFEGHWQSKIIACSSRIFSLWSLAEG